MNVLCVYAHPNEKSFNRAILDTMSAAFSQRGDSVKIKDLYAEEFSPILTASQLAAINEGQVPQDVCDEQALIHWADTLVFIYPLWWFDRPAILKGWFDRVFTNGFAFEYDNQGVKGLLAEKRAVVVVTAGGAEEDFHRNTSAFLNRSNDVASELTRATTEGTLAFCGVTEITDRVYYAIPMLEDVDRAAILTELEQLVAEL